MSWLKKKTGPPYKPVTTVAEVDAEVFAAHFAVLGVFKVRQLRLPYYTKLRYRIKVTALKLIKVRALYSITVNRVKRKALHLIKVYIGAIKFN